ncbi:ROK family protein [Streptosporangiaceae bacterium NEAU-GS5]|nr:ROK family protein [Streptosporangiaceae bacterium NEAU-GS5]
MTYALGIDFGGTKVALATAPLGTAPAMPLSVTRLETRAVEGAAAVVRRTVDACRALMEGRGALGAVGVSTFGIVRDGVVRLAPNVPGWDGLPLPALLAEEFGTIPVSVSNDVKAATAAELRWGRLSGIKDGIYLNLGTGLAAGFVVDGHVVTGAHGAAGEIAYVARHAGELRALSPAARASSLDGLGPAVDRAPLEEFVSGIALAERGSELLGRRVTAAELFAFRHDPRVRLLIEEALDALALALANLCVALDPSRVVIGGGMMGAAAFIVPHLRECLRQAVPYPPEVVPARFVDDAPLYGALALALGDGSAKGV